MFVHLVTSSTMLFGVAMVMILAGAGVQSQHLIGDHVCSQEEKYNVTIEKHLKKNVMIRDFVWCMSVPPRCSKYRTVEVDEIKFEEEERVRQIYKCCNGFVEDKSQTYCIPKCNACIFGNCTGPETCTCIAGFTGSACNQTCPAGSWGQGCARGCHCARGGPCEPRTGYCICAEGTTGLKCEISLDLSTSSSNCVDENCNQTTPDKSIPETSEKTKEASNAIEKSNLTGQTQESRQPEADIPFSIRQETTASYPTHPPKETNNKQEQVTTPVMDAVLEKSKKNFDIGKTLPFSDDVSEQWFMDKIRIEDNSSYSEKNYFLVVVISLTVGVAIILIIIAVMTVMIARYKKQRNLAIKHGINSIKTVDSNKNRLSEQPIITRNSYNAPLPDPPTFKNPVFTMKEDQNNCKNTAVFYSNYEESIDASQYDYPPSSCSPRASRVPEPGSEPLYDEIPAWRRPIPVPATVNVVHCRHSCCGGADTCGFGEIVK